MIQFASNLFEYLEMLASVFFYSIHSIRSMITIFLSLQIEKMIFLLFYRNFRLNSVINILYFMCFPQNICLDITFYKQIAQFPSRWGFCWWISFGAKKSIFIDQHIFVLCLHTVEIFEFSLDFNWFYIFGALNTTGFSLYKKLYVIN